MGVWNLGAELALHEIIPQMQLIVKKIASSGISTIYKISLSWLLPFLRLS